MSAEVPTTMAASVLREVGVIELEERPVPTPAPDEVLIQVGSVGVCGSDVHYYEHGRIGPYVVESPIVLGHEAGGTIVAVGGDVPSSRIGERVAIEPQRPCRVCRFCRSGRYNLCPKMEFYATPPIDGAFCEYVTIQADFAFAVPDHVSDDAAGLVEPLSVGIAAAEKAGFRPGQSMLIAGAGPIGIITAQVARVYGASEVIVVDPDDYRRGLAEKFGATHTYAPGDPAFDDVEADVFVDASGATPAILAGLERVRAGGHVILVGSADEIPLPVPTVAMREVNVTGTFRYTDTWPKGIQMVASGAVELDPLVTEVYGLEQVEDALTGKATPASLKRIVRPGVRRIDR
ncbi:NAD(P)-dependent alcohol dehydrogenase [Nitriliruptoraceae bacterium ZYF776]|nr:NAD(P)-dependent alcohol dehydrogenase [Profundirhabdus halotolerans]